MVRNYVTYVNNCVAAISYGMKQDLGKLDRILRFALAVWWLGPWAPQYDIVWVDTGIFLVGWIALLESFLGWCGLHRLFGIDNKNQ